MEKWNKYDKLAMVKPVSAREYFAILRLAIYHIRGIWLDTAYKIAIYEPTDGYEAEDIENQAITILKSLK